MFGKRSDGETTEARRAPPPAPAGAPIATRPQSAPPPAPSTAASQRAETMALAGGSAPRTGAPKAMRGLDQLRAAQNPTAQIVREQSDYYHATKTTIFNALLNTIDLSQLAQLDLKAAAEEIRDIVAELVAIKNVSMSVAEQEHLVQDIVNDVLGYGPLEPLLARDDIADIMVNGAGRV
ncbi:MAG: CpaF family protein, partial [Pseudomonadota bacterium]